jgi:hypothetical protein
MEPENRSPFFYRCQLKASPRKSGNGVTERNGTSSSVKASCTEETDLDRIGDRKDFPCSLERPGYGMTEGD